MPRVLSCIQPTGSVHLGNYLGALVNWVSGQHDGDVFHGRIERCKLWAVEVEVAMIESAENLALHGSVDSFKRSRMIFRNLAANFDCVVVPVSVGVVALSEEAAVFFIAARCAMQSMRRCEFVGRGDFDVRLRHGVAWIRES